MGVTVKSPLEENAANSNDGREHNSKTLHGDLLAGVVPSQWQLEDI